jgi:hypothetical protein
MFAKYHKWLFGIKFTLHTDHKSLIFLNDQSTPNMLMLTWYIPGIKNITSDTLSQLFSSDDDNNSLEEGENIVNHINILDNKSKRQTNGSF